MDRRGFLRRMGLVATGVVAADQIDLLDRLGWSRKYFPSADLNAAAKARHDAMMERGFPFQFSREIEDGGYEYVIATPAMVDQHGRRWDHKHTSISVFADRRCPPEVAYFFNGKRVNG